MDAAAKAVQFLSVGLRCQKFEGGMRAEGEDIDVRIRHNYAKTGGRGGEGSGEIKTARTGPDKLLDLWIHGGGAQGGRRGRGEERTVLGSTPLCYRRNLSRSFREGGQAREEPATDVNRVASLCPFLVPFFPFPLFPYDL